MNKTLFIVLIIGISSCSEDSTSSKNTTSIPNQSKIVDSTSQDNNANRIEVKYGKQWDFCDCVKKNDSIDKLLKNQSLSDSELDKVLKRADEVENKCKILLTDLKSNKPSDRQRHQEKVKACLEN
ncbi:MAG: hypothetical protein ACKO7D_01290 [Bacteroidota bacterium]